jgi:hypothetical protein
MMALGFNHKVLAIIILRSPEINNSEEVSFSLIYSIQVSNAAHQTTVTSNSLIALTGAPPSNAEEADESM